MFRGSKVRVSFFYLFYVLVSACDNDNKAIDYEHIFKYEQS